MKAQQEGESRTGTIKQGDYVTLVTDRGERVSGVVDYFVGGSNDAVVLRQEHGVVCSGNTLDVCKVSARR